MKALFIAYNQAYNQEIVEVLEAHGQRGFTRWQNIDGRGTVDGLPRFGNHAWPEQNHGILAFVQDDMLQGIAADLKAKDEKTPALGIRAYAWDAAQLF